MITWTGSWYYLGLFFSLHDMHLFSETQCKNIVHVHTGQIRHCDVTTEVMSQGYVAKCRMLWWAVWDMSV